MDKKFWQDIKQNNFSPPTEHSVDMLTEELLSYLGSLDPELRDSIAYEIFANWLEQGRYTPDQLRAYILRLIVNLQDGLGERESDSVFQRSFSILFLAEIVYHHNEHPFLDTDELHNILARGLEYLESEQDPRGYVLEKGWAHALAHTADLLFVLALNTHIGREELAKIMEGIQTKLLTPTDWVYIHAEDERLARAVMAVIERKMIDRATLQNWLMGFAAPEGGTWKSSLEEETRQKALFNTKTFLRSLHVKVARSQASEQRDTLLQDIQEALQAIRQF